MFALESAYNDTFDAHILVAPDQSKIREDFIGTVFSSEEDKANDLDRTLNDAYQAAGLILPKDRFATIKRDQLAWLKQRDDAKSTTEKSKLTEARIHQLQDLVWQN